MPIKLSPPQRAILQAMADAYLLVHNIFPLDYCYMRKGLDDKHVYRQTFKWLLDHQMIKLFFESVTERAYIIGPSGLAALRGE